MLIFNTPHILLIKKLQKCRTASHSHLYVYLGDFNAHMERHGGRNTFQKKSQNHMINTKVIPAKNIWRTYLHTY